MLEHLGGLGVRAKGLGSGLRGFCLRCFIVWGLGIRVGGFVAQGSKTRVHGLGFCISGLGFRD